MYVDLDPILEESERDGQIKRKELGVDKKKTSKASYNTNLIIITEAYLEIINNPQILLFWHQNLLHVDPN